MERDIKKMWIHRSLIGALLGIAGHMLLGYLLGSISLFGPSSFRGFQFPDCRMYRFFGTSAAWDAVGVLLSFALWALFGAEVGIATIPFADDGRELVTKSLLHYAVTSATMCLWAGLNCCDHLGDYLTFLVPLTLVYLLVWLGRWTGWYMEVDAIREKLGLPPKTSPLKWRETLPYFGYAFLLCLALPMALRILRSVGFDSVDETAFAFMYAWLLLPIGGFMSGLSLGKRQGVCPLYPAACAVFILIFIPLARLFSNMDDWPLVPVALIASTLGNLAGAAYTVKRRKGGQKA